MNKVILIGRTTKDATINGKTATTSIAVDRILKDKDGNKVTDFINLKWLGEKKTQFVEKYIFKGTKISVTGSLFVDNYTDKDGNKKQSVYVAVDETEFCESRSNNQQNAPQTQNTDGQGFMNIPDGLDAELPFN